MAKKLKTSSTAYRVLLLLSKLNEKAHTLNELNKTFFEDPEVGRYFSIDVILKYINTLREAGYEISKRSGSEKRLYALKNAPVKIYLDEEEINMLAMLMCYSDSLCQARLNLHFSTFMDKLCRYLSQEQVDGIKKAYEIKKKEQWKLFSRFERYSDVIGRVEQCISEKQRVEIKYKLPEDSQEKMCVTRFHKIKYDRDEVKLLYCDLISGQMNSIKLDNICNIKQLPSILGERQTACPIVFKVKGRLAKTYRPYEGEVIKEIDKDSGETTITAYADDINSLLGRLMKYGENCEVLYPGMIREKTAELIRQTLDNYSALPA